VDFDATTTTIFLLPVSADSDSDHAKCRGVFLPTPSSVFLPGARTRIYRIAL